MLTRCPDVCFTDFEITFDPRIAWTCMPAFNSRTNAPICTKLRMIIPYRLETEVGCSKHRIRGRFLNFIYIYGLFKDVFFSSSDNMASNNELETMWTSNDTDAGYSPPFVVSGGRRGPLRS